MLLDISSTLGVCFPLYVRKINFSRWLAEKQWPCGESLWYTPAHNKRRETSKEAQEPTTIRNTRIFCSCVLFTNLRILLVKNRWKKSLFNIIRITEAFCFYQLIWSSKQHCHVAKNNIITTILQRWKLRSLWKVVETMRRRIFFHLPGTSSCFTW